MILRKELSALMEKGYEPIVCLGKRPASKDWPTVELNDNTIKQWHSQYTDNLDATIGIRNVSAIDVDVRNKNLAQAFYDILKDNISKGVSVRIGQAPKFLLPFRCTQEHRKHKLQFTEPLAAIADNGKPVKSAVEILAPRTQQFIALGRYPGTKRNYLWRVGEDKGTDSAIIPPYEELPELSLEQLQQILSAMAKILQKENIQHTGAVIGESNSTTNSVDDEDPFVAYDKRTRAAGYDYSFDDMEKVLEDVEDNEDRDTWILVGQCLKTWAYQAKSDEENADLEAFSLWDSWSASASNYRGSEDCLRRWETFCNERSAGTATVAQLFKRSAKRRLLTASQKLSKITEQKTFEKELEKTLALKHMAGQPSKTLEERARKIANKKGWKSEKEKLLEEKPSWLEGWVWIKSSPARMAREENYENYVTIGSFEKANESAIKRLKKAGLDSFDAICRKFEVPRAVNVIYKPGCPRFIGPAHARDFNSWTEIEATAPSSLTQDTLNQYFDFMTPRKDYREYIRQWCAWLVQNQSGRHDFALLLLGHGLEGKSKLYNVMGAALGYRNVKLGNIDDLKGQGTANLADAMLSRVCMLDEIKVSSRDRDSVMANLKQNITGREVTYRQKMQATRQIENHTSYLMATNDFAALPIESNDRRYCVLNLGYSSLEEVKETYHLLYDFGDNLDRVLSERSGEVAGYFMEIETPQKMKPLENDDRERMSGSSRSEAKDWAIEIVEELGDRFNGSELIEFAAEKLIDKRVLENIRKILKSDFGYRNYPDNGKRIWTSK